MSRDIPTEKRLNQILTKIIVACDNDMGEITEFILYGNTVLLTKKWLVSHSFL